MTYILLFFYTLTCSGATVYMHLCHGVVTLQESAGQKNESCPMNSEKAESEAPKNHHCDTEKQNCCKDITLDLKKTYTEAENTGSTISFLNLSPAITTIYWLGLLQQFVESPTDQPTLNSPRTVFAYKPPTYLIHCNFRI